MNISALASTLASFIYSNKILFSVKLTSPCGSSRDSDLPVRTSWSQEVHGSGPQQCRSGLFPLPSVLGRGVTCLHQGSGVLLALLAPSENCRVGGCEQNEITALHQAISLSLCSHQ